MIQLQRIMRLWLTNAILLSLTVFFGIQTLQVWTRDDVAAAKHSAVPSDSGPSKIPPVRPPMPPRSRYGVIARNNLFSQDRKSPVAATDTAVAAGPDAEPAATDLMLFGIVIEGGDKKALILNPEDRLRKDVIWVRIGDQVGRYNIKDILADGLQVVSGSESYSVRLWDSKPTSAQSAAQVIRAPGRTKTSSSNATEPRQPGAGARPRTRFVPAK